MAMSNDEFGANLTVQGLKVLVNAAAQHVINDTVATLSGKVLQELIDALSKSISRRTRLKTLGRDKGHLKRITVEEGYLAVFRREAAAREAESDRVRHAHGAVRLKAAPNLLAPSSTWGGPG